VTTPLLMRLTVVSWPASSSIAGHRGQLIFAESVFAVTYRGESDSRSSPGEIRLMASKARM
jgi:hypothetical protein